MNQTRLQHCLPQSQWIRNYEAQYKSEGIAHDLQSLSYTLAGHGPGSPWRQCIHDWCIFCFHFCFQFPFPASVSSFHFISISCFSIALLKASIAKMTVFEVKCMFWPADWNWSGPRTNPYVKFLFVLCVCWWCGQTGDGALERVQISWP